MNMFYVISSAKDGWGPFLVSGEDNKSPVTLKGGKVMMIIYHSVGTSYCVHSTKEIPSY